MRPRFLILTFFLASSLGVVQFQALAEMTVSAGVSIRSTSEFYDPLTSCGTWVIVGDYGRCWHPAGMAVGWRPYCDGYWEWTDCGWYWASDEPWAWACYHCGTWIDDPGFGWCWVPGIEWAPAWVYWRAGGGYIGWAACGPAGFTVGPSAYVFVESRRFQDRVRPGAVIVNNPAIINNTTEFRKISRENRQFDGKLQKVVINNGPGVDMVEQATGRKLTAVPVRDVDRQTRILVPEKSNHGKTESPGMHNKPPPGGVAPPSQPNPPPASPLVPSGDPGSTKKSQEGGTDKDHGHDGQ